MAPERSAALPGERRGVTAPVVLMVIATAAFVGFYLYCGRHGWFYSDDWMFIAQRHKPVIGDLVTPHNGHMVLLVTLWYKLLFLTSGLKHYWAFRTGVVVLHATCAWLIFIYARRRVGQWLALAAALILLGLGAGWENILWPFQVSFLVSVTAGIGAMLLVDRDDKKGDIGAAALIGVALAGSGVGIAFAIGLSAELLLRPAHRGRIWITAAPMTMFAIWTILWNRNGPEGASADALLKAPLWMINSLSAGVGAVAGFGIDFGRVLLAAAAVTLIWIFAKGSGNRRMICLLATLTSFLSMTAIVRAGTATPPTASRYIYVTAVVILLLAIELLGQARQLPAWAAPVAISLAAVSIIGNLSPLTDTGIPTLKENAALTKADLTAVELSAGHVLTNFIADPNLARIDAAQYLAAVRDLGSPTYPKDAIVTLDEQTRRRIDDTMVLAGAITSAHANRATLGDCRLVAKTTTQRLPATGLTVKPIRSNVTAWFRRFADGYEAGPKAVKAGSRPPIKPMVIKPRHPMTLRPAAPTGTQSWWIEVTSPSPFLTCAPAQTQR